MNRLAVIMTCAALVLVSNHLAAQEQAVTPAEETKGKFAEINGIRMYYEIHGEGEPLLLLHGFFGSGRFWNPLIPSLSKKYRLIVPDLRNHGRSTNPAGTFTHRDSASDVYALLDALEVDRFRAMGFSTGGMTLLHMATSQPDRVQAMVLIGATTYIPVAARHHGEMTFEVFSATPQLAELKAQHEGGDTQVRQLIRLWHSFEDSFDDVNFTPPFLSTIKANSLIVHGDRDMYFPVEIAVEMYRSIPSSYLWIVPNGQHVPAFDKPDGFTGPLLDFFGGEWENQNQPR